MSEKNNDDESPLRPVESGDEPDTPAENTDWMDALGVQGSDEEAPDPAPNSEPEEAERPGADGDWMAQLGGDTPEPSVASPVSAATGAPANPEPSEKAATPGLGRRRERRLALALVSGLSVLVAGVALLLVAQMSSGGGDESTDLAADLAEIEAESAAAEEPTGATAAEFECEESESEGTVTGSGPGDTESVAGVILAFEHAYYSSRDAEKALDLTTDDSPLVDADALQEGIDSVPAETKHCVSITTDGDTADVEITEARPSQAPETFVQEITTNRDGDRVEIVDVAEKEKEDQ